MAAKHAGVKVDAFEWVTTDFSQRDNVIVRGDVDGATYFHDSAVSLFQRIRLKELRLLSFAGTGLAVYGYAVLAATKLINENPKAAAAVVRATNRGVMETIANLIAAMAYVKQREPMVDEKDVAERWNRGHVLGADTREHGVGDVRKAFVEQQVAEVSETFGLKSKPDASAIYNLSFLPLKAERMVKA